MLDSSVQTLMSHEKHGWWESQSPSNGEELLRVLWKHMHLSVWCELIYLHSCDLHVSSSLCHACFGLVSSSSTNNICLGFHPGSMLPRWPSQRRCLMCELPNESSLPNAVDSSLDEMYSFHHWYIVTQRMTLYSIIIWEELKHIRYRPLWWMISLPPAEQPGSQHGSPFGWYWQLDFLKDGLT